MPKISPLSEYELKLCKELYEKEEQCRHNTSTKAFQSITFLTAIFGAIVWLIVNYIKIYEHKPRWLNFITTELLALSCVFLAFAFVQIFLTLANYKDVAPNPKEVAKMLSDYKSITDNEVSIMNAVNKSMAVTYIDAAIKKYDENNAHIKMFGKCLRTSFICMFFAAGTFVMEVVVYRFF